MPIGASKSHSLYLSECAGNAKAAHAETPTALASFADGSLAGSDASAQADAMLAKNPELARLLAHPGAFDFLDAVRPYVQRGYSLEAATKAVRHNWETLLKRVGDGLFVDGSRFGPAAQVLKASLADQVWDAVNGLAALTSGRSHG